MADEKLQERSTFDILKVLLFTNNLVTPIKGTGASALIPDIDTKFGLLPGTIARWCRIGHIEYDPGNPEYTANFDRFVQSVRHKSGASLIPELTRSLPKQQPDAPITPKQILEDLLVASGCTTDRIRLNESTQAVDAALGLKPGTLSQLLRTTEPRINEVITPQMLVTLGEHMGYGKPLNTAINQLMDRLVDAYFTNTEHIATEKTSPTRTRPSGETVLSNLPVHRRNMVGHICKSLLHMSQAEFARQAGFGQNPKYAPQQLNDFLAQPGYGEPPNWRKFIVFLRDNPNIPPLQLKVFERLITSLHEPETSVAAVLFNITANFTCTLTELAERTHISYDTLLYMQSAGNMDESKWWNEVEKKLRAARVPEGQVVRLGGFLVPFEAPETPGVQLNNIRKILRKSHADFAMLLGYDAPDSIRAIIRGDETPLRGTWEGIIKNLRELVPPPPEEAVSMLWELVEQQASPTKTRYHFVRPLAEEDIESAGKLLQQIRGLQLDMTQQALAEEINKASENKASGTDFTDNTIGEIEREPGLRHTNWGVVIAFLETRPEVPPELLEELRRRVESERAVRQIRQSGGTPVTGSGSDVVEAEQVPPPLPSRPVNGSPGLPSATPTDKTNGQGRG